MTASPELAVTVSADLLRHLRAEARRLDVALEWVIAGLVADTMHPVRPVPIPLAASS